MRVPWQKPPIKYERWFDSKNSSWITKSCKLLVVDGEKASIISYYYGENKKQIKQQDTGYTRLKECIKFLENNGWLKYEVKHRPTWTYGDDQIITGKVMVIGEL